MWTCPNCGREFKRTNQDHYCGSAPATVDEYILKQDESVRETLFALRDTIRSAIPEARETIAWGMPTWKGRGNIIHFAASKNHLGVYPGQEAVNFFKARLEGTETNKGVIRLKWSEPIPFALIADIAKWCFSQDKTAQH